MRILEGLKGRDVVEALKTLGVSPPDLVQTILLAVDLLIRGSAKRVVEDNRHEPIHERIQIINAIKTVNDRFDLDLPVPPAYLTCNDRLMAGALPANPDEGCVRLTPASSPADGGAALPAVAEDASAAFSLHFDGDERLVDLGDWRSLDFDATYSLAREAFLAGFEAAKSKDERS